MRQKYLGILYAHSSAETPPEVARNSRQLETFMRERFRTKLGEKGSPAIYVISGRTEHRMTWRGDWEKWQKHVVSRKHSTTGDTCYHMFVVPNEECGRATAAILEHALSAGRKLFLWEQKTGKLKKISGIQESDADDWTRGYRVITT